MHHGNFKTTHHSGVKQQCSTNTNVDVVDGLK